MGLFTPGMFRSRRRSLRVEASEPETAPAPPVPDQEAAPVPRPRRPRFPPRDTSWLSRLTALSVDELEMIEAAEAEQRKAEDAEWLREACLRNGGAFFPDRDSW